MSELPRSKSIWRVLPLISFIVSEWLVWYAERAKPCYGLAPMPKDASELPPYPIDMQPLLSLPFGFLDEAGVPYNEAQIGLFPAGYHPTTIAQYALAHWNAYLLTGDEKHRKSFIIQADWLVEHESRMHDDAGGWPLTFPLPEYNAMNPWLSALTQGNGISVLIRAYRLTRKEVFLQVARRAVRTFELDIRDGGVSTSIGDDGVFFEEYAAYPAAHVLNGYIFSLFGLYDYVTLTGDAQIAALIKHSLGTMHTIINEYDLGYWSCYELLNRHPAPLFYHDQHSTLLVALSRYSSCEHCVALAVRWAGYQHNRWCRLRYFIASRIARYYSGIQHRGIKGAFFRLLREEEQIASETVHPPIIAPSVAPSEYPPENDVFEPLSTTPLPELSIDQALPDEAKVRNLRDIDEIPVVALPITRPEYAENTTTSSHQAPVTGTESLVTPLRDLIKSSGLYAISSVTLPLISLLLAPFLTRALSPTDYGILTVLNTLISLSAGITQLGLSSAFFRAYGYDYTSSADRRYVLGTVFILLCLVSLPTVMVAAITAPFLAHLLFGQPSFGGFIVLATGVVLLQNLSIPGFAWLRAENRALSYSLLSIGSLLITLIANILLVGVLHLGLAGSLLATGCGYASVMICTLPIISHHAVLRMRTDIARNLLAFGIPIVFNFISYWVLQLADRYLLSVFSSLAETARYGVAYTLGSAISIVVLGPFALAWPTALFAIAKREDAAQVYKYVFRWFSLFLLFTAFGLSLAGTILLHWLFPVSYHSGANTIPIVAVSLAFFGLYYVFGIGISIMRKTWLTPILLTVAAFANVALNLVLIPHYGAMGAAVSTLIAYVVLVAISYIVNQRLYPVPFEINIFLIALLIGTALYVGGDILGRGFGTYGAWGISACTLILYGGCLALLGKLAKIDIVSFSKEGSP